MVSPISPRTKRKPRASHGGIGMWSLKPWCLKLIWFGSHSLTVLIPTSTGENFAIRAENYRSDVAWNVPRAFATLCRSPTHDSAHKLYTLSLMRSPRAVAFELNRWIEGKRD